MEVRLSPQGLSFVAKTSWASAEITPVTQDASARRYFRLTRGARTSVILMDSTDAPPDELDRFLSVGAYLHEIGLSAPELLASDGEFTLLEDFGDARFADLPADQVQLYQHALDTLLHLQSSRALPSLPHCDFAHLGELAATVWDWYPLTANGTRDAKGAEVAELASALAASLDLQPSATMLRDFHAENLMWLPNRTGVLRVGLLDFQDAMLGHPAFDVVSLLQDARRDIAPEFEARMCAYFQTRSQMPADQFAASYAALGAIRNLRIIGMFARLGKLLGRPAYIDMIPRVWRYLQADLNHPRLSEMKKLVTTTLPEPTETYLSGLKSTCPKSPLL